MLPSSHGKSTRGLSLKLLCQAPQEVSAAGRLGRRSGPEEENAEAVPLLGGLLSVVGWGENPLDPGAYMRDFPEEKDRDNSYRPQRELLADKHH